MVDMQGSLDGRQVDIDQVGVSDLRYPITVLDRAHERQRTVARLSMSVGLPRFDKRADLTQLGVVALSLVLGRPIHEDEYPASVEDLVATARARRSDGSREPLPAELLVVKTLGVGCNFRDLCGGAFTAGR